MHNHSACAAKGEQHQQGRHFMARSTQRATINIHKAEQGYQVLVFAPGRIKEHFQLQVAGNELTVTYTPPEGFPRPEWVLREYSRGAFSRTITLGDAIDATNITARYVDGVLDIHLPLVATEQAQPVSIPIH
jgi:HSP20 family protein